MSAYYQQAPVPVNNPNTIPYGVYAFRLSLLIRQRRRKPKPGRSAHSGCSNASAVCLRCVFDGQTSTSYHC